MKSTIGLQMRLSRLILFVLLFCWSGISLDGVTMTGGSGVEGGGGVDYTADADAVSCWDFIGDDGNDDCGANNVTNTGACNGTVTFAAAPSFAAASDRIAEFDGGNTSCLVSGADPTTLESETFTISCYVLLNAVTPDMNITGKGFELGVLGWRFGFEDTGDVASAGLGGTFTDGTNAFSVSTWTHTAMTYNGTTAAELFVDGQRDGLTPSDVTMDSNDLFMLAGGGESGGFNGDLLECIYFDVVMTDAEICDMCKDGMKGDFTTQQTCNSCTGT